MQGNDPEQGGAPRGEDEALAALGLAFDAPPLERQLARQLAAAVASPAGPGGAAREAGAQALTAAGAAYRAARGTAAAEDDAEDDLERLLACELAAAHHAAMACLARATEAAGQVAAHGDPAARERDTQLRLGARFIGMTTRQANALTRRRAERRRDVQARDKARAEAGARVERARKKSKPAPDAGKSSHWVWDGGLGRIRPSDPERDKPGTWPPAPGRWREVARRNAAVRARLAAARAAGAPADWEPEDRVLRQWEAECGPGPADNPPPGGKAPVGRAD